MFRSVIHITRGVSQPTVGAIVEFANIDPLEILRTNCSKLENSIRFFPSFSSFLYRFRIVSKFMVGVIDNPFNLTSVNEMPLEPLQYQKVW